MTQPAVVRLEIDERAHDAPAGLSLAALLAAQGLASRRSVRGEPRTPWCGMGVCGECRVTVDGREGVLACLTPCRDGLRVRTGGAG